MVFPNFHRKPLHSQFKSIGKRKTRLISIKIDFSKRQNRQQNPYNTMYFPKKSYNIYPAFSNHLFTLLEHENVLLVILTLKQVTVQSISIFLAETKKKIHYILKMISQSLVMIPIEKKRNEKKNQNS